VDAVAAVRERKRKETVESLVGMPLIMSDKDRQRAAVVVVVELHQALSVFILSLVCTVV